LLFDALQEVSRAHSRSLKATEGAKLVSYEKTQSVLQALRIGKKAGTYFDYKKETGNR
jgi:hypothetical protein